MTQKNVLWSIACLCFLILGWIIGAGFSYGVTIAGKFMAIIGIMVIIMVLIVIGMYLYFKKTSL
ncbi:MAG: hypothetical protein KJ886_05115 [Candidatus Thermoplasmatota archaeon]|nr:hypothetical protein [Candidatus Thermoplasmatota archaeon]MCG2827609.1 hypothetical protein [Thermoplasmatales archaeon]